MSKPILHLNLQKEWYDMIESGQKIEEYRMPTPYWFSILGNGTIYIKGKNYEPTDVCICFSNGYNKNRRQMLVECLGLDEGPGKPEWGAVSGQRYYVLQLGNIIMKNHS